jgi:putative tryptophan/tyrosine transport system substrate-binding protein
MRRREFIAGLAGAAASPLAARARQPALPVVGYLTTFSAEADAVPLAAFRQGLSETGYIEGRNVAIEYRRAENANARLPALVDDLIRRRVAVIAAHGTPTVLAAKAATRTIPIVFMTGLDPVELGLVASLPRPGGNLTGGTLLINEVEAKRLELLHALVPAADLIAVLVNPASPDITVAETRELQVAARILGVRLLILKASSPSEFEAAFSTLVRERAGGLVVGGDILFVGHSDQIVALAARHAVPAIYPVRELAEAGGLMSYGASLAEMFRLVGVYTGRILKGDRPADLPVQQATLIQLTINFKTANALGFTFPMTLRDRADKVIE